MRALIVVILLFALMSSSALAVTDYVIPVEVRSQTNDLVGKNLVNALQEEIRRTSYMRLAGPGEKRIVIYIQTNSYSAMTVSVYGAAWTLQSDEDSPPLFLSVMGNWTGGGAVRQAALTLIEHTDKVYQRCRGLF